MSKYCPNKATPEFREMSGVLGDDVATAVWYTNKGNPVWETNTSIVSPLFTELMAHPSATRATAIAMITRIHTKAFAATKSRFQLNEHGEPTAKVLGDYLSEVQQATERMELYKQFNLLDKQDPTKPMKWSKTDANYKKVSDRVRSINSGGVAKATLVPLAIGAKEYYAIRLTTNGLAFKDESGETTASYDAVTGTITFSEKGLTAETVVHEFAHPFVDAIAKDNPALFENLIAQINSDKSNPALASIFQHLDTHYADASVEVRNKELLTYTISEYGKGNIDVSTGTNTKSAIKAFYDWVSNLVQELQSIINSNGSVSVDRIHPNTKYSDLATFFTVYSEKGSINLEPAKLAHNEAVSEEDHLSALLAFAEAEAAQDTTDETLPPAYKTIESVDREENDITDESAHMASLLPKSVVTVIEDDYIKVLSGGKKVVGMFEFGIISLMKSAPKGTGYHEGFHAVFRTMLAETEQDALIDSIKSQVTNPSAKEIFDIEIQFNISTEAATKVYYEEILADMFADYMQDKLYNAPKGVLGLFAKLAAWIKGVFVNVSVTKALFSNINSGKYTNTVPNVVRGVAYKVHPTLDVYEVQQTTRELVSLAFVDISIIEDLENKPVNFQTIEPMLRARFLVAHKAGDTKLASRIGGLFAQGTQNLDSFWYKEMDAYMRHSLGLKPDTKAESFTESTEDEATRTTMLTGISSYNISGKESASAAIKFLVAMTPVTQWVNGKPVSTPSQLTGLPQLVDYGTTYNDIENLLSGIVAGMKDGKMEDGFQKMRVALESQAKYKPELLVLANKLKSLPPAVQTQFFVTFSRQKGGYVDHLVKGTPGVNTKSVITDSNTGTKDTVIRDTWASQFAANFGEFRGNQLMYNSQKIADFMQKRGEYMTHVNNLDPDTGITSATRNKLQSVLELLGVKLSPHTIQYMIDTHIVAEPGLSHNANEYTAFVENVHSTFITGTDGIFAQEGELTNKTNFIKNEDKFFRKLLATSEAHFKKVAGENSFLGPDGNQIWPYQDNDMTSKMVSQFKQGDLSQLKLLAASPYGKHSLWLKELIREDAVGAAARADFTLAMYGNVKDLETRGDKGDKAAALKPVDAYMDNFNKHMQGYFIGLAEADKGRQTYFRGPKFTTSGLLSNVGQDSWAGKRPGALTTLKGYLADEINRMTVAESALQSTPEESWTIYYHYYPVAPGTGTHGVALDKVKGNAFQSFLFPKLDLVKHGLVSEGGQILPMHAENFENNEGLDKEIKKAFYAAYKNERSKAIDMQLVTEDPATGKLTNRLIDSDVISDYSPGGTTDFTGIIADYTLNSIIGSIEQTKLFNGDLALYKVKGTENLNHEDASKRTSWGALNLFGDFMKRVPAIFAAGKDFRIFNDSFGVPVVPTHYSSATIENIEVASSYFGNAEGEFSEDAITEVSKATGLSATEVKTLFKPYLKINQTDAQAWITLDVYKERMHGLGKWTPAHDTAYDQATSGEIMDVKNVKLLAQPLKTVHAELVPSPSGEMIMHYNKQSEAVLLPFMKDTRLGSIMTAMEREGVGHVIVLDGKKAGGSGITAVTDTQGNIKEAKDITLNGINLSYNNLFLQQDLTPHGIGNNLVASQTTKNGLSIIKLDDTYFDGDISGAEAEAMFHETVGELSDRGLISFDKSIGFDPATNSFAKDSDGRMGIHKMLQKEFEGEISENHMEALNSNISLDSLPIKAKIANKLQASITKSTVKLQQQGGAFIQMTDLGFIGKESEISESVKNGIIWFGNPTDRLKPMHLKEGETKPAQVLLPYSKLAELMESHGADVMLNKFGKTRVKDLTKKEFAQMMEPSVLEGFAYRIPNQGPSSNDAFVIAGVLPTEMGDTIVMFSDVTTKTGADFDIDKMFIVMPNIHWSKEQNKIVRSPYKMDNIAGTDTKGLENLRLDLMRQFILHPKAYAEVMAPLDDNWLEVLAGELFPANQSLAPLEFFTGSHQLGVKSTFDNAKSLVGSIANHASHHAMSVSSNLSFEDYYLGVGNTNKGGSSTISESKDTDGRSIASTLGVYMNAIVDAAKDPFITRANLNQFTASTAFMLARAGTSREWTTAFIGQPILKALVAKQASMEGRFSEKVWDPINKRFPSALESVLADYGMGNITEEQFKRGLPIGLDETYDQAKHHQMRKDKQSDIHVTSAQLSNNIQNPNMESDNFKLDQLGVLKQFLEWQAKAGEVNELIKVAKVDVDGATKSLLTARMASNLLKDVLENNSIVNKENLLGISLNPSGSFKFSKGKGATMTSRYFENSIEASLNRFSRFFLTSSEAALVTTENLSKLAGYDTLIQKEGVEKLAMAIANEVYSLAASDTEAFRSTPEEMHEMLFGSENLKSLSERVRIAKNDVDNTNLFLNSLDVRMGVSGSPDNIMMPNNESVAETKEVMFSAWDELLGNPATAKLGKDLIKYAFYKSGFSKTIGDFSEHIPTRYLEASNFNAEIKVKNAEYSNDAFALVDKQDRIVKHLYGDNKLVPVVSPNAIKSMRYTGEGQYVVDEEHGFIVTGSAYKVNTPMGYTENQKFVKKKVPTKFDSGGNPYAWTYQLFQYIGSTHSKEAVYIRTNTLGKTGHANNIKEYIGDGKTSIFPENNVTLPTYLQTLASELTNEKNLTDITVENLPKKEDADDQVLFCAI